MTKNLPQLSERQRVRASLNTIAAVAEIEAFH